MFAFAFETHSADDAREMRHKYHKQGHIRPVQRSINFLSHNWT